MLQNNIQAVYQKQNNLFNICINTCTYNRCTLRTISSFDGDIVILKVSNKKRYVYTYMCLITNLSAKFILT